MTAPLIVSSVLYGMDEMVKTFVAQAMPPGQSHFAESDRALGVVRRGKFCGGVVFHDGTDHTIFMSGAFIDPMWPLPQTLRQLFSYPFIQLQKSNLLTVTAKNNARARKLDKGLGFIEVGVIHNFWGQHHAVLMEMPAKRCRWLKERTHHVER